ncbi:tetratricopeptide repeat protein [Amycolatopsis sp. NBC_01286]|uniref:tetratricopeptide repeat protein n=1 Tax=Amycolatopsis sp. NBC_01286 TaxID=2903560 RepID=UPI002E14A7E8|nr:hypothetical protein OG570_29050 [Amycolatopsis sp. NBC_01286]
MVGGAGLTGTVAAIVWLLPAGNRFFLAYTAQPPDRQSAFSGSAGVLLTAVSLLVSVGGIALSWRQLRLDSGARQALHLSVPGEHDARRPPGMTSLAPPEGLLGEHLFGRSALVKDLCALYGRRARRAPRVRVLHGMGGAGKTTVALLVAGELQKSGVRVWWVSAATETSLQAGLRELAARLGATDSEIDRAWTGMGSAPDLLWRLLSERKERWLLVVDNADDSRILGSDEDPVAAGRGWIRPVRARYGAILVTTRDGLHSTWGARTGVDLWCRFHRVEMLSTADGAQVLLDHARHSGTPQEAADLARRLGGHALALGLAGRYLADANQLRLPGAITTFAAYLAGLESRGLPSVFERRTGTLTTAEARRLVDRTWELSLDLLQDRGQPQARTLLPMMSLLADAPIPYQLLDSAMMASSPLFPGIDAAALRGLLHALSGLGLLDLGESGPVSPSSLSLRIHPLVRDTSRLHLSASGQHLDYLVLAVHLISHFGPEEIEDPANWPTWRALAPHALHLHASISGPAIASSLLAQIVKCADRAVQYLAESGWHLAALTEAESILRTSRDRLGARHKRTMHIESVCAWLRGETGNAMAARDSYAQLVPVREVIYGPTDPITLSMKANHAWWIGEGGDAADARDRYAELVALRERISGPDQLDTLIARSGFAWWLGIAGDAAGARDAYASLLLTQEKVCGPDHPSTLVVRANHIWWAGEAGDVVFARDSSRALLPVFQRIYGPDHTETIGLLASLARRTREAGDPIAAREQLMHILNILEPRIGLDHPETLVIRIDLAASVGEAGEPHRAWEMLTALLPTVERIHGQEHRVAKAVRRGLTRWSRERKQP